MTEEERTQLLIEDLSPRLPYEVKGTVFAEMWNGNYDTEGFPYYEETSVEVILTGIDTYSHDIRVEAVDEKLKEFIYDWQEDVYLFSIEEFNPILRPMDSMTEEEREELKVLCDQDLNDYAGHLRKGHGLSRDGQYKFMETRQLKWLLKKHFDFNNIMERLNESGKTDTGDA